MGRKKRTDLAKATDYGEYKVTVRDGLIGYGIGLAAGFIISGICSLFLAAAGLSGGTDILTLLRFATLAGLLPVASRIDRRLKIIPNSLILFLLGMWVFHFGLLGLAYPGSVLSFLSDSLAGGLIGLSLILVRLLTKRSLGMGDCMLLFS